MAKLVLDALCPSLHTHTGYLPGLRSHNVLVKVVMAQAINRDLLGAAELISGILGKVETSRLWKEQVPGNPWILAAE